MDISAAAGLAGLGEEDPGSVDSGHDGVGNSVRRGGAAALAVRRAVDEDALRRRATALDEDIHRLQGSVADLDPATLDKHLHEGKIGLALVSMGYEPYDDTQHIHQQAQDRSIDFNLGWFMEPVFRGDYPFAMRALVEDRLPYFSNDEQKRITGTYDMMGLNYYTSRFSQSIDLSPLVTPSLNSDDAYSKPLVIGSDGKPIGPNTGTDWLYSYPEGLKNLLIVMKERYRNPPIYITENGIGDMDNGDLPREEALNDTLRLQYLKDHLAKLKEAGELGVNIRGHFTWSLMDNFEWQNGYTQRFGVIYVDRKDNFKRYMKKSARWYAEFNGVGGGKNIRRPEFIVAPVNNNGFPITPNSFPTPNGVPAVAGSDAIPAPMIKAT